jgi:hypothetical protein
MKEAKSLGFLRQKGSNAMSNIVQFPGGRYLPPTPSVDALIGELAAVEIELARARLAQIRNETRRANAAWTWSCFKRALFWGFALWLLATLIALPAHAGQGIEDGVPCHDFSGAEYRRCTKVVTYCQRKCKYDEPFENEKAKACYYKCTNAKW